MNETLKRLGGALKGYFRGEIRRPLNWRMIDAIETLKETELDRNRRGDKRGDSTGESKKAD